MLLVLVVTQVEDLDVVVLNVLPVKCPVLERGMFLNALLVLPENIFTITIVYLARLVNINLTQAKLAVILVDAVHILVVVLIAVLIVR